jgi:hypothetical protein
MALFLQQNFQLRKFCLQLVIIDNSVSVATVPAIRVDVPEWELMNSVCKAPKNVVKH